MDPRCRAQEDAAPLPYDAASDRDASIGARRCCANLSMLGCSHEATDACAVRIDLLANDKLRNPPFDVDCCASAGTKEAVRLCPAILCE